jgi:hypothetical protein
MRLLYETFSGYGASLSSFKLEDSQEASATTVYVRLGLRGTYKLKFDQSQAALSDFTDEQLGGFAEMLQTADEHLRGNISNLQYRTHAFFYNSHCESSSKSTEFLRDLVSDKGIVPLGDDLGSGVILNWHDPNMNANVSIAELKAVREEERGEEIPITPFAFTMARMVLSAAFNEFDAPVPLPAIAPDGSGGIRIEWARSDRNVRAIIPSSADQRRFVYHIVNETSHIERLSGANLAARLQQIIL